MARRIRRVWCAWAVGFIILGGANFVMGCDGRRAFRLSDQELTRMAAAVRMMSADAVELAQSGHPGLPLGMADVAAVLWGEFLNVVPSEPDWPDRDRFVLSAGHGSALLYSLLHLSGFDVSREDLAAFRQLHSKTPGHPEYGETPGVEVTTGPLAQGFAHGVGMALAEKLLREEFGSDLCDHWTYVMAGDGCLMEGLSQEALSFAGHQKLARLVVLFDDNEVTIDGPTSLSTSEDHGSRFEAAGWHVHRLNGHCFEGIRAGLDAARAELSRPSLLICKTTIGKGAPTKQGTAAAHGAPLGKDDLEALRTSLGLDACAPFELPDGERDLWRVVGARGATLKAAWQDRVVRAPKAEALRHRLERKWPVNWMSELQKSFEVRVDDRATRQWSGIVLERLNQLIPGLLGGSADLSPSNNTRVSSMAAVMPDRAGSYVHYGVREHLMAAAMGGVALHGGFVPYGGTFLAFSDYMRPAVRLSALMNIPVIYVFTHDSIGLGEDGPTHQPVEHIESLRLMPNLKVFRPADGVETVECWMAALKSAGPSALLLSRQKVSAVRSVCEPERTTFRGAYVLREASGAHVVTLFATGSEVGLATEVRNILEMQGFGVRVVSAPCLELFEAQDEAYRAQVLSLGKPVVRVSIEAGATKGWRAVLGVDALTFGIDRFGASAPAQDLYKRFGLEAMTISQEIKSYMDKTRVQEA